MEQFGNTLHRNDIGDLDLIDPDNLYHSNGVVNQSDYLFNNSTSNDFGDFEHFDHQSHHKGSLFSEYDVHSMRNNLRHDPNHDGFNIFPQHGLPSNCYYAQNEELLSVNSANSFCDEFQSLDLTLKVKTQGWMEEYPENGYPSTGSYTGFDHYSPFSRFTGSGTPISSCNVAASDYRQARIDIGQPMKYFNGDLSYGGFLPLEGQCCPLAPLENSDDEPRRKTRIPKSEYKKLSAEEKKKRKKELASKTTQRYTEKQKEKVKQMALEEQILSLSIQGNEDKLSNMEKKRMILEKSATLLQYK